jgi:hypothetical protein
MKNKIINFLKSFDYNLYKKETEDIKTKLVNSDKKLDEIYWASVFNSAIKDSYWLEIASFNPGRWAAGFPMLYILFRVYNDAKPKSILEFGLGESSKLLYQYGEHHEGVEYQIIDHNEDWVSFFSSQIFDIKKKVLLLNLEKGDIQGFEVTQYQNLIPIIRHRKYDLIIVDGPYGSIHHSRPQVVEIAKNKLLADDFIIIVDDCERNGEQETLARLIEVLKNNQITFFQGYYTGIKQTCIICSKNYQFLTSL